MTFANCVIDATKIYCAVLCYIIPSIYHFFPLLNILKYKNGAKTTTLKPLCSSEASRFRFPHSIHCTLTAEDRWCKCVSQDRSIYVPTNDLMHLHINSITYLLLSTHLSLYYWVFPACVSNHTSLFLLAGSVFCVCCRSHQELSDTHFFVCILTGQI